MNVTKPFQANQTSMPTYNAFIHGLHLFYVPCLALLGICGNIICAIVFSTRSLKRVRSSSFLFVLALADAVFSFDLLPGWINTFFIRSLYKTVHFTCELQIYISFVASFLHIWMVLAFTAERFFAVNFPLKHLSQCTPTCSRIIITIVTIPAFLFYIYPSFFATEIDMDGQCREKASHVRFLNRINIVDTIMTMLLPFILVSVINVLIIKKLFCSNTFRQHVFENGSSYQCRRSSMWPSYHVDVISKHEKAKVITDRAPSTYSKKQHSNDSSRRHILTELRLTKMLLAISLTCLSLNFPSYYLRLIAFYEQSRGDLKQHESQSALSLYTDVVFHYLSYLSYSINIFIYILFGANFRRELKRMFFWKRKFRSRKVNRHSSNNDMDLS